MAYISWTVKEISYIPYTLLILTFKRLVLEYQVIGWKSSDLAEAIRTTVLLLINVTRTTVLPITNIISTKVLRIASIIPRIIT